MAKASKKSKKHGNKKVSCQAYRSSGRREKNKKIKLIRHFRHGHTKDVSCITALKALKVDPSTINAHSKL